MLICSFETNAQEHFTEFQVNQPLKFNAITAPDGISPNWVRCIYQDNQGFMWFGTSSDLFRYDGYVFKGYNLGNVNVNAIAKKNDNEFWICNDLGVFIYDQHRDTIYSFNSLKGKTVLCVLQENNNRIWFGTNTGLYRYTSSDDRLTEYTIETGLSNNYVNTLFLDSRQTVWIGTKAGLNRYNSASNSFVSYKASTLPDHLSGNDIMAICEDHEHRLWIGSAKDGTDLLIETNNEVKFKKITDGAVVALLVDHKNRLWIGTSSNGGILQIDLTNFSPEKKPDVVQILRNRTDPRSISDNSIFCFFEDRMNDIWIGTFGGGVNYFSYRHKKFYSIQSDINTIPALKNDLVNAIWEEEKYLWLGTEGGLDRYDKSNKTTQHFKYERNNPSSLSSDPVYSLFKDSRGNFWAGTWTGGLNLFDYKTNTFKRFIPDDKPGSISSENVFAIYEDSRKNLWVGTVGGGLNRYDFQTGLFKQYRNDPENPASLYSDIVHDIKETKDGRLLIASFGSLDVFNYSTEDFKHYPLQNVTSGKSNSRYITFIFIDSAKHIWLGTNDGLILFNEDEKLWRSYTVQDGLTGNTIQSIEEDNSGNLWISTNNGLSKLVHIVDNIDSLTVQKFYEQDGLGSNEFKRRAAFKNNMGQLYFGTSRGFCYFHPDSIFLNETPSEVAFVEMQLLQYETTKNPNDKILAQNINSIEKIELPYNKSDFLIIFSTLNYLNQQKNSYKYMLSGYDPDWVNNGIHRTATYKNLQPGNYIFKVIGANNDEIWSQSPKILNIIIAPPFWQTWLFRIAVGMVSIGIILLLFTLRLKAIQNDKRKLELMVAERTNELRDANGKLEEQSEELSSQNDELRKNQLELSLYKDQLEELVIQRTKELEKAKNKAEESDRLKSAFLANMSHEIRTPLNAITGFSLLLNNPEITEENRKKYYEIIQANTKYLLMMMDDILDLSTIETKQIIIKQKPFSPSTVLKEVYHQFQSQVTENIDFKLKTDENTQAILINSDEHRFRQIIANLLSNAFKFTEKGTIEMGYYIDANAQMVYYVKDSGIGISEEEQKIIFKHFTKIEKRTKFFRGIGLGLTLCKLLTELLGGKIWMESEMGIGSTFFFTIPQSSQKI